MTYMRLDGKERERVADRANVKAALTVFWLARVMPYSSWVQQPTRVEAILGRHLPTH